MAGKRRLAHPLPRLVAGAAIDTSTRTVENRLLELATAAEGLYARLHPKQQRMTRSQAEAARRAATRAVPPNLPEDVRSAVREALGRLGEPTFAQRLRTLAERVEPAAPGITGDSEKWVQQVEEARNSFAHQSIHGPKGGTDVLGHHVLATSLRWSLADRSITQLVGVLPRCSHGPGPSVGCQPPSNPVLDTDFVGETARLYARFRRDLPSEQAGALAASLGLVETDVVVDLGCGTGQLTLPLRPYCAGVLAVDPEAGMLAGLRARQVPGVVCVLGDDGDLPALAPLIGRGRAGPGAGTEQGGDGAGAVVVANALHWMDERSALSGAAALLRAGGGLAVVTQAPPLWLGQSPWQQAVREVLEDGRERSRQTCGSDQAALDARAGDDRPRSAGQRAALAGRPRRRRRVGARSPRQRQSAGALSGEARDGLGSRLRAALADADPATMVEHVTTTALIGRRPG